MTYRRLGAPRAPSAPAAFLLVYLTSLLDNVLLSALVPAAPAWLGAGDPAAPLAVGAVLAARPALQLLAAPLAAALTLCLGPACALRLGTAGLAGAALALASCAAGCGAGGRCALCAGAARGAQGAAGALAGVAGVALVSRAVRPGLRRRALGALLGAVALGVLVGYALGGASYQLWSRAAPFQLLTGALLADLALQYTLLDDPESDESGEETRLAWGYGAREMWAECAGAGGLGAGAVLASSAVVAAMEPCLPLWLERRFEPPRWLLGLVFVPDSAAYLAATALVPALGGGAGAAAGGLAAAGAGALLVSAARSVRAVALGQALVGAGVGALDAALVPALLARARRLPHCAALLQAAASAALAAGPVLGGAGSWLVGFPWCMRALGAANLLYAAALHLYLRDHPLQDPDGPDGPEGEEGGELTPLGPSNERQLH